MICQWKKTRSEEAAQNLFLLIGEFVKQHKLDISVFKKGELSDIGKELDVKGVGVNLKLYHRWGKERQFYYYPETYKPSRPTGAHLGRVCGRSRQTKD
jgi:hypothetical protein